MRTFGVTLLGSMAIASACTVKESPDSDASAGTAQGGSSSGNGGQGGTTSKAGTANKAGTTSKAGSGGSSGSGGGGSSSGGTATGGEPPGGAGGEGPACPGCASGFCLPDGTCVDCLAENDRCPQGQYCTAEHECTPGCKADGTSCASGSCAEDHNCNNCIEDAECMPGLVCGGGLCAAACTAQQEGTHTGCSGDLTCCSLHCTQLLVDSQNCGSCGHACGDAQFCGLSDCGAGGSGAGGAGGNDSCVACQDVTLSNVCSVSKVIVILDTSKNPGDGNRVTGRAMGDALKQQCPTQPVVSEAEQDSLDGLNYTTGQPVSDGSQLLVVAGGPFYQVLEGYLESEKIAPIYWKVLTDTTEFRKTSNDEAVLSLPIGGDHESHDMFIIQFMRDPKSGSLVLNAQGFWLSGTVAATYQLENVILPNLAAADQAWYAYEWTDGNGNKAPDAGEIELIDSGS